ncbi:MAG: GxxExxY protein [Chitinophagaceae bacterium]|nr:GxxExxY protein [Chitinophagaceae bacterium]
MPEYKYGDITEKIIGACLRIHNTLGNGFPEVIYQRALALELRAIGLSFEREFDMDIYYMNQKIGSRRVDFFVENKISVELKALLKLEDGHLAQAINYLEVYNLEIGMLINFGAVKLQFHRFTNKKFTPPLI